VHQSDGAKAAGFADALRIVDEVVLPGVRAETVQHGHLRVTVTFDAEDSNPRPPLHQASP